MDSSCRPPFDPSFIKLIPPPDGKATGLAGSAAQTDAERVAAARQACEQFLGMGPASLQELGLSVEELNIPGPRGDIPLAIVRPQNHRESSEQLRPAIFHIHEGGLISGNAYTGLSVLAPWIEKLNVVVVSVDYRLASEHPGLAPVEDCYAALSWLAKSTERFNIDPKRLSVMGLSAGAGLSAGVALMAKASNVPSIHSLLLGCPMLDDRNSSVSSQQYWDIGTYTGEANAFCWERLLDQRAGGPDVSAYEAPGRATDLSGFPPTFIDVGSAEPFRDEAVAFASMLWKLGAQAELHVWPGGPHGYELMAPDEDMSQRTQRLRFEWLQRQL